MSIDPDRVVVKRVVLTGHPFKVQKRSAVVRYMFFNAGNLKKKTCLKKLQYINYVLVWTYKDDVKWFKPIELHTKTGKRGHIKEELGTHGHMKCQFNDVIKAQEKIMLNLYKRVFPKWSYIDASDDFVSNEGSFVNKME